MIKPFALTIICILLISSCAKKASDLAIVAMENSDIEKLKMALAWQEANPIANKSPTDWTHGAYYTGVTKAYENTKEPSFLNAIRAMSVRNNWQTWNRMFHADDVAISYAYLYLQQLGDKNVDLAPTDKFLVDHFAPSEWRDGKSERADQVQLWW